ncbi:MAG TPA: hypothetical protein VMR62_30695 [Bryobacteraceae bacterium]|jgi:hypothetical protein|nr:hypothetical protein [Bryobacteraceae bacterium]
MKDALQYSADAIGLCLNLLVITALTRGGYRQYPFVFTYTLTLLVSTVLEMGVRVFAPAHKGYYSFYWANELILDILVFCVVIAFIDEAGRQSKLKILERRWLVLGAATIFAASVAVHHNEKLNQQMTLISRDLNICAVILDLMLWSLLVTARRPNRRLLLLSGGLGLQLTGAIMGEQLRHFSHTLLVPGTLLEILSGFLGLYIWWRALRPAPVPKTVPV